MIWRRRQKAGSIISAAKSNYLHLTEIELKMKAKVVEISLTVEVLEIFLYSHIELVMYTFLHTNSYSP
jgi:hypothetical protein